MANNHLFYGDGNGEQSSTIPKPKPDMFCFLTNKWTWWWRTTIYHTKAKTWYVCCQTNKYPLWKW